MKEWKEILNYEFDESGTLPEAIDVSDYTDFFIETVGLTNKSTVDSHLKCHFGDVDVNLDSGKSGSSATLTQTAMAHYNGLLFEQVKTNKCLDPNYYTTYGTPVIPYTYKLYPNISPLSFKLNSSNFAITSGKIKIYAR